MKNKLLTIILIVLVTITLVAVVVLALVWQMNKGSKEGNAETATSIDEIIEASVDIPEITTNLADRKFVRLSLKIQTDSEKAAEELEKREFQVQNIVIHELSEVTREELEGKAGKEAFESTIQSLVDPLMQEGDIERVYIVSYIIQ